MGNAEQTNAGMALIEMIGSGDLASIGQDLGEVALDSVLQDSLLRDIPVLGLIASLARAMITIRDRLLLSKVLVFLQGLKEVPRNQREKFLARIDNDRKFGQRVGETLLMRLDGYDDFEKAGLMSKLFNAYLRENINYDEFLRFSTAIDRAYMGDLRDLLAFFSGQRSNADYKRLSGNLYLIGFSDLALHVKIDLDSPTVQDSAWSPEMVRYELNSDAKRFAEVILEDQCARP